MNVLIVGGDRVFSIENFYYQNLKELGIKVSRFLAPNLFYDYYEANTANKVLFKLGFSRIYLSINNQFKSVVEARKPDIVWIFKGMELFPESLDWVRKRKIKLVNYNPDNPFLFSGRGSGNGNITNSIGLYDLHFTYNSEIKMTLERNFSAKTYFLPFGFEVNQDIYDHCSFLPEIVQVCFLGNPDIYRASFINKIAKAGISIAVFGHDWNKFVRSNNVDVRGAVYGKNQWEILRRYRIQLNLMRPHNQNSHNMRSFEVPGIGGIMLAPDTSEHQSFFKNNEEAFFFTNFDNCIENISSILSLASEKANEIRTAARNRCLNSGYDYHSRTIEVKAQLELLFQ